MHEKHQYNFLLLNPILVYCGLTLLYFIPAYISGMFFSDVPILTLSAEAINPKYLNKGLLIVAESLIFFSTGFWLFKISKVLPKKRVFLKSKLVVLLCLALVIVGIIIYGPSRYFFGGYAVYDIDDARWQIGNGLVYFCAEVLIGLALIIELTDKRKVSFPILFLSIVVLFLLLFRLKRLELLIAILSFFSYYVCIKAIRKKKIFLFLLLAIVLISLVGGFRFGIENASWLTVAGSVIFEANYTVNSLFGTIYLIDDMHFSYTYGLNLLTVPLRIIPSFLFPYKYDIIGLIADDNWSKLYNLSPLGASFGLSHLYRYGGQAFVIIFSFFLGGAFKFLFVKFKLSVTSDIKSIYLLFYPIILYSFTFHFIRDDLTIAFKFLFQLIILYYILVILKSEILSLKRRSN